MLDKSSFTAETCAGKYFDGYTGEIEVSNPQRPKICATIAATDSYSLLPVMR